MSIINKIKVPNGTSYDISGSINNASAATVTQSGTTNTYKLTLADVSAYDGLSISFTVPATAVTGTSNKISLNNGTAVDIVDEDKPLPAGQVLIAIYKDSKWHIIRTTGEQGGPQALPGRVMAGPFGIKAKSIVMKCVKRLDVDSFDGIRTEFGDAFLQSFDAELSSIENGLDSSMTFHGGNNNKWVESHERPLYIMLSDESPIYLYESIKINVSGSDFYNCCTWFDPEYVYWYDGSTDIQPFQWTEEGMLYDVFDSATLSDSEIEYLGKDLDMYIFGFVNRYGWFVPGIESYDSCAAVSQNISFADPAIPT